MFGTVYRWFCGIWEWICPPRKPESPTVVDWAMPPNRFSDPNLIQAREGDGGSTTGALWEGSMGGDPRWLDEDIEI